MANQINETPYTTREHTLEDVAKSVVRSMLLPNSMRLSEDLAGYMIRELLDICLTTMLRKNNDYSGSQQAEWELLRTEYRHCSPFLSNFYRTALALQTNPYTALRVHAMKHEMACQKAWENGGFGASEDLLGRFVDRINYTVLEFLLMVERRTMRKKAGGELEPARKDGKEGKEGKEGKDVMGNE